MFQYEGGKEMMWRGKLLFSCSVMCDSLRPHGLQHARLPCLSPSPRTCSNSSVDDAIQPSCPLSSPFPPAFTLSQHQDLFQWVSFVSGGQSIGASASAPVLPMNIQGWFLLGLTDLISLLSRGLSRVFFSTTVWKPQFFSTQASYGSVFTAIQDYWKNHSFDCTDLCQQSDVSSF